MIESASLRVARRPSAIGGDTPSDLLLGLGEPRIEPLDVAFRSARLPLLVWDSGQVRRNPALGRDFWELRARSDVSIIARAAKLLSMPVPAGFFPAGFGFERLGERVRRGVVMMTFRRHLAGVPPYLCGGLPFGYWDDCLGPSGVVPMSWDMCRVLVFLMIARDVARVRSQIDEPPEGLPDVHRQASAIMERDGWSVEAAVGASAALLEGRDVFFGPGDASAQWREARLVSYAASSDPWVGRYGTLCA